MSQNITFLQASFVPGLGVGNRCFKHTKLSFVPDYSIIFVVPSHLCSCYSLCLECLLLKNRYVIFSVKSSLTPSGKNSLVLPLYKMFDIPF